MEYLTNLIPNIVHIISIAINCLLLGGNPRESISGRSYREDWKYMLLGINTLFFFQEDHCRGAYNKDIDWAVSFANNPRRVKDSEADLTS